jgi:hypothetical protein
MRKQKRREKKIRKRNKAKIKYKSEKKNTKAKRKIPKQDEKYGSKKKNVGNDVNSSLKHAKRKQNESRFALKRKTNLKRNQRTLICTFALLDFSRS